LGKNLFKIKKVLWLTDACYYDDVLIEVLENNGDVITKDSTPDRILSGNEDINKYDAIVTTMYLGVGEYLDINQCNRGTKTGIIFLQDILPTISEKENKKIILRVLSMFEIDTKEYEWCKANNVIVVNEFDSHYDTIAKIIHNNEILVC
jgi:hypothetical protein